MSSLQTANAVITGGAAGVQAFKKVVPQLEDEVVVEVVGQPGCEKQQLYFLALAAANGEVRRFANLVAIVAPAWGLLMIEFDQASNWVRCTIRYKTSMLVANSAFQTAPILGGNIFNNLAVYRGPSCELVGGNFDFVDNILAGLPDGSRSPDAPNSPGGLPFANQTILTPCPTTVLPTPVPITQAPAPTQTKNRNNAVQFPSPNPKPPGDSRSRGAVVVPTTTTTSSSTPSSGINSSINSNIACCAKTLALIPMVFAALSAPATNASMRFVTPVTSPDIG
jgi:hypothetical protein